MLPFAHILHRYVIPVIPAVALLAVATIRQLAVWLHRERRFDPRHPAAVGAMVLFACLGVWQLGTVTDASSHLEERCRYYQERHERAGRWLAEHTSGDAVVATHDVGAIAYYSERRVIDMVGLIHAEVVPYLHTPGYVPFLKSLFQDRGVTHLAVLRNWMEVVNAERLLLAHPEPELLEIFTWEPERTHILSRQVSWLNQVAEQKIARRDPGALQELRAATDADPLNSPGWFMTGVVLEATGDPQGARLAYGRAVELFPERYPPEILERTDGPVE
jgi:hypothetical protein